MVSEGAINDFSPGYYSSNVLEKQALCSPISYSIEFSHSSGHLYGLLTNVKKKSGLQFCLQSKIMLLSY